MSGRLRSGDGVILSGTLNVIPAGQLHGPFYGEEEPSHSKSSLQRPFISSVTDRRTSIRRTDARLDFTMGSIREFLGSANILR